VDNNVWLPELSYYAKQDYVVASVSYSLPATWFFPEMLMDIKTAIRYLKVHAEEWNLDPDRFYVMGESAGGHLAALTAVTGGLPQFEGGKYEEASSSVKGAVLFYPAVDMLHFGNPDLADPSRGYEQTLYRKKLEPQSIAAGVPFIRDEAEIGKSMDPRTYIGKSTPPMLILHGTEDTLVDMRHSEVLYEALKSHGSEVNLYLVEGVNHAAAAFVQPEIKKIVLDSLDRWSGRNRDGQ